MSLASMLYNCLTVNLRDELTQQQQDGFPGDAVAIRMLLDHMMPVLTHVVAVQQGGVGMSPAASTAAGRQDNSMSIASRDTSSCGCTADKTASMAADNTAERQGPSSRASAAADAATAVSSTASSTPPPPHIPADIALSLLAAASRTVGCCLYEATSSEHAYRILSRGLQHVDASSRQADGSNTGAVSSGHPPSAGAPREADDMVGTMDAVLSLTCSLISRGAWWQEAKAKYPLLLIETLYTTYVVSKCHL
jgi:hypothetical protein